MKSKIKFIELRNKFISKEKLRIDEIANNAKDEQLQNLTILLRIFVIQKIF